MFTLEALRIDCHNEQWIEFPETYRTAEQALAKLDRFWENDDYNYAKVRLKKTVTLCTIERPTDGGDD